METRIRLVPRKLRKFVGRGVNEDSDEGVQERARRPPANNGIAQPRLNQVAAVVKWCRSIQSPTKVATAHTNKKYTRRTSAARVLGMRANCKRNKAATRRSRLCSSLMVTSW